MSKRIPSLLIDDIIESSEKILNYTQGLTYEQFLGDERTIDAVIRNFEIIGEAANRLPEEFKEKYAIIDWYKIRGFRNRIVHHYFGIDHSILWQIKETFLPEMLVILKRIDSAPSIEL